MIPGEGIQFPGRAGYETGLGAIKPRRCLVSMKGRGFGQPMSAQDNVSATVKWFNRTKGFGFVQMGDGSPDAFLHISVVQDAGHRDLPEGTVIICNITEGQKGPQVASILRVEHLPASAPPAPAREASGPTETIEGRVKFFNVERGFGFVIPEGGGQDVFVSVRTLERIGMNSLEPNQRVRLHCRMGHKGPMAEGVELLDDGPLPYGAGEQPDYDH